MDLPIHTGHFRHVSTFLVSATLPKSASRELVGRLDGNDAGRVAASQRAAADAGLIVELREFESLL